MPAADDTSARPRRILVAGVSGVGKTTLAKRIAAAWGVPHIELDGLFHGPGWVPRPEFLDDVRALAAQDSWVTEWQYADARPLLLERADLLVWIDLPVPVALRQLVRRTLLRRWRRTELWNGNVEPPLWTIFRDDDHILRWGWRTRHKYCGLDARLAADAPHVQVVRLRSRAEVESWVGRLGGVPRG